MLQFILRCGHCSAAVTPAHPAPAQHLIFTCKHIKCYFFINKLQEQSACQAFIDFTSSSQQNSLSQSRNYSSWQQRLMRWWGWWWWWWWWNQLLNVWNVWCLPDRRCCYYLSWACWCCRLLQWNSVIIWTLEFVILMFTCPGQPSKYPVDVRHYLCNLRLWTAMDLQITNGWSFSWDADTDL